MNAPKWVLILVLVLALSIPATPVSAAPSASLSLTQPVPNPGLIGSDVSFELVVNATEIDPGVGGVEVYVGYTPAFVAPSTSPTGVVQVLPDFFGVSNVSIKEVLPAAQCPGAANPCVHLVVAGPPQKTHTGAAARFFFKGIAEGAATFTVLKSVMVNSDGMDLSHSAAAPVSVPIVFRAGVIGTVKRQGTPVERACGEVKVMTSPVIGPVFTSQPGSFTLTGIPPGTFTLHAEYPGYLASEKSITAGSSTSIDAGITTLRGGDVNYDKAVNILDIGSIISKFSSTGVPVRSDLPDCTDPDDSADINDDGNINISDLAIAAGNWGQTGPTPWQP